MVGDIKHILVIQSLPEGEKTGLVLYENSIRNNIEYLQPDDKKMSHRFADCNSADEIAAELTALVKEAKAISGGILVHIEAHGSEDKKGLVLKNGKFMSWEEFADLLRPINVESCNNLFLTMATCNGRFLYQGVDSFKKSPYSGFISASKEISQGEVEEKFALLFNELTSGYNLVEAYKKLELSRSNFYYKDSLVCFEEAIEVTKLRIMNPAFRQETMRLLKEAGIDPNVFDLDDYSFIASLAFENTYYQHKQAFIFDCK